MDALYIAHVDEIPTLSEIPHEIAEEISAKEVADMWQILKTRCEKLEAALKSIEWADPNEFCAFCGRQRAEGHNSVCRMNKYLRAAGL